MFDYRDYPLRLRKKGEVAGIRNHGKLGVGDELDGLNGALKAEKIVISEKDENRRFERAFRDIHRATMPLEIDRNDRVS